MSEHSNSLERGLVLVRKERLSSQKIRGTISSRCQDFTWKVSQQTGQTLVNPTTELQ